MNNIQDYNSDSYINIPSLQTYTMGSYCLQHAWGEQQCIQGFDGGKQKKRDHQKDLDVCVRII
jgi:hypothetical protein